MLGLVPKSFAGFLALLPFTSFRCIRCGKLNWRLSEIYRSHGVKVLTIGLILATMSVAMLYTEQGSRLLEMGANQTSIRREVSRVVESVPPVSSVDTAKQADPRHVPAADTPAEPKQAAPRTLPVLPPTAAAPEPPAAPAHKEPLEEISISPEPVHKQPVLVAPEPAPAPAPARQTGPRTAKLTIRPGVGVMTIIIAADGPVTEYNSFMLKAPARLVVDLPGEWKFPGNTKTAVNEHIVKSVRAGVHKEKLRFVIDLTKAPASPPEVAASARGMVITIP